ncbi:MAG: uroporphyrinogen-III synthase [Alphaproteobacteria bacterium]|nr:uroporphyrinogen-III synthase [Alphaproteobacteria bacterium]
MAPLRVLVTRPEADAGPLAERLAAEGFDPVIEPLLRIRFRDEASPDLSGLAALAFTSANGVRALVHLAPEARALKLPVFVVGPATAAAARAAGFADVRSADGDVAALANLVARELGRGGGPVVHVAGRERAGDLVGALAAEGLEARREVLYDAIAADSLSSTLRAEIEAGAINVVLIFSPRTARLFVNLMENSGLEARARTMCLVALSPAVAEAAAPLPWGTVRIADAPRQDAALDALAGVRRED